MRIAIVHDWLVTAGGGERVLAEALRAFPGAEVHALIDQMSDADHAALGIPRAHTTWMQSIPGIGRGYRSWLPLMPLAMRSLNLQGADVVIAISHAVAKAAPVHSGQKLLCLCLSPMRYAWDLRDQYLDESGLAHGIRGALARAVLDRMQSWDLTTSGRVDKYASISRFIADRVRRAYGRDSEVIYPPVDTQFFTPRAVSAASGVLRPAAGGSESTAPYFITASRFVPYKRIDLIARAFAGDTNRRLVIVGDGPDAAKVRAAAGPNVMLVGQASGAELRRWLQGARAFVFAAEEDFGIAPLEAQACGAPVIAYGKGGVLETIVPFGKPNPTGLFYDAQTVEAIRGALDRFEANEAAFTMAACRQNAERFGAARFREALTGWVSATE
jgi:glycosyltransferase involved in cell wall biosynthesis